ncbi:alpha-amylase family glycosyl hydrolase [Fodinicola feengrottensis]|uniref:Alpha-amylase family glycosyl hydrolase n=2 Tax=Fodinicola feengrottensis TaxID=435914 RepID=A0ABN2FYW4_9ACTN
MLKRSRMVAVAVGMAMVFTMLPGAPGMGAARATASPAATGIDRAALGHDGQSDVYRVPAGTVAPGSAATVRFRTAADNVDAVTLRLTEQSTQSQQLVPMRRAARSVSCYDSTLVGQRCDFWETVVKPTDLGAYGYRFVVQRGQQTAYYADQPAQFGAMGASTDGDVAQDYRIHVVRPDFPVVGAMKDGVMYQIMPDRFDNGDPSNDVSLTRSRYDYPAPPNATPSQIALAQAAQTTHRTWNQLPAGGCRDHVDEPCTEQALGRDYFGGDLQGIAAKIPYLHGLGASILYLTPIFASKSNHAYDVEDFTRIDPAFGGAAGLRQLLQRAHRSGIKVILDVPFDPSSSDSPYFDRYHHYPNDGACESVTSPYRSWFTFTDLPVGETGPCAGSKPGLFASYEEWGNVAEALPLFRKHDPGNPAAVFAPVADYFYNGPQSIARRWLDFGADGFRLDSMQDESFPTAYWQQFRTVVKDAKPGAPLVAEGWHFADNMKLTNGDQADTPMGYRFRAAVLSLMGAVGDDKSFPGDDNPTVPVSQFAAAMQSIRQDYPDATYRTFMNLLDSHDTARIRWMLTPGKYNSADREANPAHVAAGLAAEKVAATIQFTVPGMPSVYYGDEVGVTGSDDPDNRRTFPWTGTSNCSAATSYCAGGDRDLLSFYTHLASLRKTHPVLRDGDAHFLLTDDTAQTLGYAMRSPDDLALVLVNRSSSMRTLRVPLGSVARDGIALAPAFGAGAQAVTSAAGVVTASVPPMTAQVLVATPGQDLTPPPAPQRVSGSPAAAGRVSLRWSTVTGASRYEVWRSPLSGGGYERVGVVAGPSFVDTPDSRAHYVVRAVDAAGNIGAQSAETAVTPSRPITAATLTSATQVDREVGVDPTTVTADVTAPSIGDPTAIRAEVGLATAGGSYDWRPMSGAAGLHFSGGLRPESAGSYDFQARFSSDGGHHWTYTARGTLVAKPSTGTTPPAAPAVTMDWSASTLSLQWPSDPDAAEYRVYRSDRPDPVATLPGSASSYVDPLVSPGKTYSYQVRAFDSHLHGSALSARVSHRVEPKIVTTTFRVKVPSGSTVYLAGATTSLPAGASDPLCLWCGGNATTRMHESSPGIWELTVQIPDHAGIQWKYTRGNWNTVEVRANNRTATVTASPGGQSLLIDNTGPPSDAGAGGSVTSWADQPG